MILHITVEILFDTGLRFAGGDTALYRLGTVSPSIKEHPTLPTSY